MRREPLRSSETSSPVWAGSAPASVTCGSAISGSSSIAGAAGASAETRSSLYARMKSMPLSSPAACSASTSLVR